MIKLKHFHEKKNRLSHYLNFFCVFSKSFCRDFSGNFSKLSFKNIEIFFPLVLLSFCRVFFRHASKIKLSFFPHFRNYFLEIFFRHFFFNRNYFFQHFWIILAMNWFFRTNCESKTWKNILENWWKNVSFCKYLWWERCIFWHFTSTNFSCPTFAFLLHPTNCIERQESKLLSSAALHDFQNLFCNKQRQKNVQNKNAL